MSRRKQLRMVCPMSMSGNPLRHADGTVKHPLSAYLYPRSFDREGAARCPDAFGQYPAGSRSEDDPCHGLRRLPTGGASASSLSGIGAT